MNVSPHTESPIVAWVGLDWADREHVVSLQVQGSSQVERLVIKPEPESLQHWIQQLRTRFAGGKVAMVLEQSRGAVLHALMQYDCFILYPINPKSLAWYRESLYPSNSKDDPADADLLRELVQKHPDRFHAWVPDDPETRQLRLLVEYRRQLVDQQTRLTNQLTSLLKSYYPQALSWAGDLATPQACDFLERWPTLEAVQKTSAGRLKKFYAQHHCRKQELIEKRIEQIRSALPLTRDRAILQSMSLMVVSLVRQLRPLLAAIEEFNQQIADLFGRHPDHDLFAHLPGAGAALGPRLLTAFGSDRNRFQMADEVQRLSGIAPVTQKSGKTQNVFARWACPKFLRQTFQEFAGQSIRWSVWAKALYRQKRSQGMGHHAILRVIAYKWIRILFRCWKNRTPYDESRYLAALQYRQKPQIKGLSPA
jgi:transposase